MGEPQGLTQEQGGSDPAPTAQGLVAGQPMPNASEARKEKNRSRVKFALAHESCRTSYTLPDFSQLPRLTAQMCPGTTTAGLSSGNQLLPMLWLLPTALPRAQGTESGLWSCCRRAELSRVLGKATQPLAFSSNLSLLRKNSSSPASN